MANPINQQSTSNDYTDACTIAQISRPKGGWFAVGANNGDVFVQLQYLNDPRATGNWTWTAEQHLAAGAAGSIGPDCTGIRFRSYTAGTPAIVSASVASGVQPALALSAFGTPSSGVVNYLGEFTLAQWPPSAPQDGDVALFADTYDGVPFSWFLKYQPTVLGATYPWGPPPTQLLMYTFKQAGAWNDPGSTNVLTLASTGGDGLTQKVPRPGNWLARISSAGFNSFGGTALFRAGVNNSNSVAPAGGQVVSDSVGTGVSFAYGSSSIAFNGLAAAATLYTWLAADTTVRQSGYTLGIAPSQIA